MGRVAPLLLGLAVVSDAFRVGTPLLRGSRTQAAAAAPLAEPRAPAVRMDFGGPRFKMDAEQGEVADVPFEIRFSLGNVISASGALLFVFCIGKFLFNNGESDIVSTFGFVYAIPALVGGLALKYAELPPVPVDTTPAAEALRAQKSTTIQSKIFSDATRFTYGDAHMEDPLRSLKLAPRGMGPPELIRMSESVLEGEYALTMRFYAPNTPCAPPSPSSRSRSPRRTRPMSASHAAAPCAMRCATTGARTVRRTRRGRGAGCGALPIMGLQGRYPMPPLHTSCPPGTHARVRAPTPTDVWPCAYRRCRPRVEGPCAALFALLRPQRARVPQKVRRRETPGRDDPRHLSRGAFRPTPFPPPPSPSPAHKLCPALPSARPQLATCR